VLTNKRLKLTFRCFRVPLASDGCFRGTFILIPIVIVVIVVIVVFVVFTVFIVKRVLAGDAVAINRTLLLRTEAFAPVRFASDSA
jgi:hypothetical protein